MSFTAFYLTLFALTLLKALLVTCEFALIKIRYTSITPLALARLKGSQSVKMLLDRSEHIARALRFSTTAITLTAGCISYSFLRSWAQFHHSDHLISSLCLALLFLLPTYHALSYLVPRALSVRNPELSLKSTAWIVLTLHFILYPWVHIFKRILGLFGITLKDGLNLLDVQVQIQALGQKNAALSPFTQKILQNTLRMKELEASDILLPRNQVKFMNIHESTPDNIEKSQINTHTRFPLCDGDLDQCLGIIHIKDIFRYKGDINALDLRTIKRPILQIPENAPLQIVLRRLLRNKVHMALVVDEFQRTVGVITLENILEELVGDIQDEFDKDESLIENLENDKFRIAGLAPVHEVADRLKLEIDSDIASTLGGLITAHTGGIPEKSKKIKLHGMEVVIESVSNKRILSTIVKRLPQEED